MNSFYILMKSLENLKELFILNWILNWIGVSSKNLRPVLLLKSNLMYEYSIRFNFLYSTWLRDRMNFR